MSDIFRVRVAGRGYEVDANGHVAGVVLMQYGQHARWECLRAAGVDQGELLRAGIGPVSLEESIRFHHELRPGEEVDVSCTYVWGDGKTFRVRQELRRPDGTLIAEISNVGGLLDLTERRLLPNPGTLATGRDSPGTARPIDRRPRTVPLPDPERMTRSPTPAGNRAGQSTSARIRRPTTEAATSSNAASTSSSTVAASQCTQTRPPAATAPRSAAITHLGGFLCRSDVFGAGSIRLVDEESCCGRGGIVGSVASAFARPVVRMMVGNLAVAVGYWTFAQLGSLAQYTGNIEVAWLPVGFAAGMLYLGDLRWFLGGMVGDFVVGSNFGFAFPWDGPDLVATAGNTIEFVLAAYLMRRWLGSRNVLERPADVGRLFVAIGIGTAVSAVVGNVDAVWLGGAPWSDFGGGVRTWWLGDTSGGLLIAPLLMVWWAGSRWPRWHLRQLVEGVGILGLVSGVSVAVFSSHHPLTYLVYPALVLAAVYLGQRGATLALFLTYAVAVGMTAANVGPFVSRSIDDQTLDTQLYVLVASVTTLILGAAVSARRRAAVDLARSRQRERERAAQERQRIARDLHDSVSQTLFSLGLQAGIAKHEVTRTRLAPGSALPATIDELAQLAHGALVEMRASIFDLRGGAVAEQGLVAALGAHGAALGVRHDVSVSVEGPSERLPLSPAVEELLFRIGQEAVTNSVKHSGSVSVSVKVTIENGPVALVICDRGVGFDPGRSYGGHLGLELMRSRASEAGGLIAIDSSPTAGTAIRVVVPSATAKAVPLPPTLPAPRVAPPASVS